MAKKKSKKGKPKVNPELEGFKVEINEFGEVQNEFDMDKLFEFLNKNVKDKKIDDKDGEEPKKEKKKKRRKGK